MEELLTMGGITALVVGLTEITKRIEVVPERFIPLVSLFFGLLLAVLGSQGSITALTILSGLAIGLSACGLYSGVKKTITG